MSLGFKMAKVGQLGTRVRTEAGEEDWMDAREFEGPSGRREVVRVRAGVSKGKRGDSGWSVAVDSPPPHEPREGQGRAVQVGNVRREGMPQLSETRQDQRRSWRTDGR